MLMMEPIPRMRGAVDNTQSVDDHHVCGGSGAGEEHPAPAVPGGALSPWPQGGGATGKARRHLRRRCGPVSSGRDAGEDRGERNHGIGEVDTTWARGAAGDALPGAGRGPDLAADQKPEAARSGRGGEGRAGAGNGANPSALGIFLATFEVGMEHQNDVRVCESREMWAGWVLLGLAHVLDEGSADEGRRRRAKRYRQET